MFSDKVFQIALLISCITHGVILFQNPNFFLSSSKEKLQDKNLEVHYLKAPQEIKVSTPPVPRKMDPFLKIPAKITAKETTLPPAINKEDIFRRNKENISQKYTFTKPVFIKPDIIAIRKKITLSPTSADKISSPSYIAHSQIVREKIKRALYQNYSSMETGQIYLSFILSSDGSLRDVRLSEEKSSPSSYLREVAVRSIRDAAPFPNFPKELDYDQLTFNVIVSFEIE